MKRIALSITILLMMVKTDSYAQENYGNTLNFGLGLGYYGYSPTVHLDYEINVARNFTLAPSISFYSYHNDYYWGNHNYPSRYYHYTQTVIPIGLKGTYYFDDVLNASSKWDFYLAGSVGVAIINTRWDDGYYGERNVYRNTYRGTTPLYLDAHIGTEYHINEKAGLFLDLSTGVSTFGVAIHL